MKNQGGFGIMLVMFLVLGAMAGMFISILMVYALQKENEQLTLQLNKEECYKIVYNKPPELEVCSATSTKIYDENKSWSWTPKRTWIR